MIRPYKVGNHFFWSNFNIPNFKEEKRGIRRDKSTNKEIGLVFNVHKSDEYCNLFNNDFCIKIKWEKIYRDSLSDSYLYVELTKPMRGPQDPVILSKYEFNFDINEANNYGWLSKDKKFFSSESLANYLFKILLDKIEKELE
ncbi:MAG: hypothetical protein IIB83_09615 [Bacteroidetes bacterium]|nr:hypothetical protein [Bacteroidota bacterium]